MVVATASLAAEPAPPQRELLQPPVSEIHSPITDRFAVRAVYFRPTVATTVRYDDSAGNPGTRFGAARELGMQETKNQGWLDMMIRVAPRHRVLAEYYQLTRTGDKALAVPISFGDSNFPQGTRVLSEMDLRTLGMTYLYSPLRREKVELAAGLGIHLLQVKGSLEAPAQFQREQLDTAGPFPSLVVDGTWRITRRFSLNGTFHYLTVHTSEADGDYMSWRANLQYRGWRNLAIGAGYFGTRFKVDSTDTSFRGFLDMWYTGPEVFARVSF
jgi:hypothetical protein